jgi:S-formylglutathione hydrolase FrmB
VNHSFLSSVLVLCLSTLAVADETAGLRFEVTVADGLLAKPRDGRVLVVLSRTATPEPRRAVGRTGMQSPPVLGRDAKALATGATVALDASAAIFPIESLSKLPAGDYFVQAVFHHNDDLNLPDAPGNLYSKAVKATLDPAKGGTVALKLTERIPDETLPADTATRKYIKLESKLLSQFHGRTMVLRAGLSLPAGFDKEPERRYPLRVHIGGYGSRFTSVARFRNDDPKTPMLILHLDGAGPYGDPYQVNSANNGPYGDAITQELIPYVEKTYRGIGEPHARFTNGHSTGGWVSFALQVFYPDFFNGCWSFAPDPVDFRAYELINIYDDANAYLNRTGFERPSMRTINGDTVYTVRHETQMENVLGRGDSWTRSGKDWGAWNATFGPRGDDGQPRPLWDPKTGKIDRSVVDHWKKYDLRLVLESNWATLAPKLKGKMHVWVGDADDYFLNNGVHHLNNFLSKAQPPYEGKITFGPRQGHGFHPLTESQTMAEMIAAMEKAKTTGK